MLRQGLQYSTWEMLGNKVHQLQRCLRVCKGFRVEDGCQPPCEQLVLSCQQELIPGLFWKLSYYDDSKEELTSPPLAGACLAHFSILISDVLELRYRENIIIRLYFYGDPSGKSACKCLLNEKDVSFRRCHSLLSVITSESSTATSTRPQLLGAFIASDVPQYFKWQFGGRAGS